MSWLDDILESTKELESPKRYFLWSALCALSAVVKDNVWVNRGGAYLLYPNIYVILYGPSGLRKGLPIALARELVTLVGNTRVISGRSSIEGIIQDLSQTQSTPNGMIADSAGFIVASEFASSLVRNPIAITILTDLFDRIYNTDKWKNTIKQGPETLKRPIITLLGGANEAQLNDILVARDVTGGFLGRTYIISETKRNTKNSLARAIKNPPDKIKLAAYLAQLKGLKGEFQITDEALDYYDSWYMAIDEDIEDNTGTLMRIGDTIFRVAMLLSLSVAPELVITKSMIETAITISEPLIPSAQRTAGNKGSNSLADQTTKLLYTLLDAENHRMSRIKILKKHWKDFDAIDLDRIILTLDSSNIVKTSNEEKGVLYYELTPDAITQLTEWKQRKAK